MWFKTDFYYELKQKFTLVDKEWTYSWNAAPFKIDIYRTRVFENAGGLVQQYFFLVGIKQPWDEPKAIGTSFFIRSFFSFCLKHICLLKEPPSTQMPISQDQYPRI